MLGKQQGRDGEALEALRKIRYEEEVEDELKLIRDEMMANSQETTTRSIPAQQGGSGRRRQQSEGGWWDLLSTQELMGYRTLMSIMVLVLPLLTGVVHITIFTPVIFASFLSPSAAILAFMGIIGAEVLTTIITIRTHLMDRAGRRVLLVLGSLLLGVSCAIFAIFTSSSSLDYHTNKSVAIILIFATSFFVMNFAYSWGPLAWLVAAEVFPQHLRAKGVAVSTLANALVFFAFSKAGPIMALPRNLDLWGTFTLFAALNGMVAIFVLLCLPETNQVHLEDMECAFRSFLNKPWYERMSLSSSSGGSSSSSGSSSSTKAIVTDAPIVVVKVEDICLEMVEVESKTAE